jgi:hypothetical protein
MNDEEGTEKVQTKLFVTFLLPREGIEACASTLSERTNGDQIAFRDTLR